MRSPSFTIRDGKKTDPNGYPTVSTRMDLIEPDFLDLNLDTRYSVSKLDPKPENYIETPYSEDMSLEIIKYGSRIY